MYIRLDSMHFWAGALISPAKNSNKLVAQLGSALNWSKIVLNLGASTRVAL